MKLIKFLIGAFFMAAVTCVNAQTPAGQNYVTIGVFRIYDNAVRFTNKANKMGFNAQYAINPNRQLYYVYLLQSDNNRQAYSFMMKIRVETEFKDAWIFRGSLGIEPPKVVEVVPQPKEEIVPPKEDPVKEEPKKEEPIIEEKPKVDSVVVVAEKPKPAGKPFFFKLVNADTGNPVMGEIHVLEAAKATEYQAFLGNEIVYLLPPKNNLAIYQVSTLAPGYREMKRAIDYTDPASSAAELGPDQEFVIALPVVRVKTGDYIEFTGVRFFQNSAILQPDSKNELDGLADLMKENTKYKITIHGHCNGTESRDIVTRGTSTDFFATSSANQREHASSKRLSELRAELVKDYMVSQGIDGSRIKTKGEGGTHYIYPKNSTLAARNDRVEIEIKKGR